MKKHLNHLVTHLIDNVKNDEGKVEVSEPGHRPPFRRPHYEGKVDEKACREKHRDPAVDYAEEPLKSPHEQFKMVDLHQTALLHNIRQDGVQCKDEQNGDEDVIHSFDVRNLKKVRQNRISVTKFLLRKPFIRRRCNLQLIRHAAKAKEAVGFSPQYHVPIVIPIKKHETVIT